MHYPNKKISTTLKEIFRSVQGVATALLLFLKDNWSLFFLPWILFATDDDDVCVCVCVCVNVMEFETTSSIIVYPKSCSKRQVLHLFQWGTCIISSVHVV